MRSLLDWLSPPSCAACDRPLFAEQLIFCELCEVSLTPLFGSRCPTCGQVGSGASCHACRQAPPPHRSLRSLYAYGGALAVTLRRFKYGRRLDLARPLAALLAPGLGAPNGLIVPIPSSRRALRHRGFDPLREILRVLPVGTGTWAPLLKRVDDRGPQAGLPASARRSLGSEAFRLTGELPPPDRPLLILDDVLTTGATVRAAAGVLRAAGRGDVGVVTLVRSEATVWSPEGDTR